MRAIYFYFLEVLFQVEKVKKEPTIKRRKNLLISKVPNISYNDLYFLYENDCKLRNISPITIKGYEFAHKKFKAFADDSSKFGK